MPESRCPSVTRSMKPTTMADINKSRRSVVMSAMPACFLMNVFVDLILELLLLVIIEIGHAAEGDLRGQIGANVLIGHSRSRRGPRAHINVDRADLVFGIARGDAELVYGGRRRSIRKIVSKLQIL